MGVSEADGEWMWVPRAAVPAATRVARCSSAPSVGITSDTALSLHQSNAAGLDGVGLCRMDEVMTDATAVQLENQRLRSEIRSMCSTIKKQSSQLSHLWAETNLFQLRNTATGNTLMRDIAGSLKPISADAGFADLDVEKSAEKVASALYDSAPPMVSSQWSQATMRKHHSRPGPQNTYPSLSSQFQFPAGDAYNPCHTSSSTSLGLLSMLGRYPSESRLPLFKPSVGPCPTSHCAASSTSTSAGASGASETTAKSKEDEGEKGRRSARSPVSQSKTQSPRRSTSPGARWSRAGEHGQRSPSPRAHGAAGHPAGISGPSPRKIPAPPAWGRLMTHGTDPVNYGYGEAANSTSFSHPSPTAHSDYSSDAKGSVASRVASRNSDSTVHQAHSATASRSKHAQAGHGHGHGHCSTGAGRMPRAAMAGRSHGVWHERVGSAPAPAHRNDAGEARHPSPHRGAPHFSSTPMKRSIAHDQATPKEASSYGVGPSHDAYEPAGHAPYTGGLIIGEPLSCSLVPELSPRSDRSEDRFAALAESALDASDLAPPPNRRKADPMSRPSSTKAVQMDRPSCTKAAQVDRASGTKSKTHSHHHSPWRDASGHADRKASAQIPPRVPRLRTRDFPRNVESLAQIGSLASLDSEEELIFDDSPAISGGNAHAAAGGVPPGQARRGTSKRLATPAQRHQEMWDAAAAELMGKAALPEQTSHKETHTTHHKETHPTHTRSSRPPPYEHASQAPPIIDAPIEQPCPSPTPSSTGSLTRRPSTSSLVDKVASSSTRLQLQSHESAAPRVAVTSRRAAVKPAGTAKPDKLETKEDRQERRSIEAPTPAPEQTTRRSVDSKMGSPPDDHRSSVAAERPPSVEAELSSLAAERRASAEIERLSVAAERRGPAETERSSVEASHRVAAETDRTADAGSASEPSTPGSPDPAPVMEAFAPRSPGRDDRSKEPPSPQTEESEPPDSPAEEKQSTPEKNHVLDSVRPSTTSAPPMSSSSGSDSESEGGESESDFEKDEEESVAEDEADNSRAQTSAAKEKAPAPKPMSPASKASSSSSSKDSADGSDADSDL